MTGYYAGWSVVGMLVVLGVAFLVVAFTANRLMSPSKVTREKLTTYECGLDPVGEGWAQTQIRYYVFAFMYTIFAVDAVFLFPWATVFAMVEFGWSALVEMAVFLAVLGAGLLWAWRTGVLTWT